MMTEQKIIRLLQDRRDSAERMSGDPATYGEDWGRVYRELADILAEVHKVNDPGRWTRVH